MPPLFMLKLKTDTDATRWRGGHNYTQSRNVVSDGGIHAGYDDMTVTLPAVVEMALRKITF